MDKIIKVTYKIDHATEIQKDMAAHAKGHFKGSCYHFSNDDISIVALKLDDRLSIHAGIVHPEGLYVVERAGTTNEALCVLDFQISSNNRFILSGASKERIIYGSYISDSSMKSTVDYEKKKLTKYLTIIIDKEYLDTAFNCLQNTELSEVLRRHQFFVYNQMDAASNIEINSLVQYLFSGERLNNRFIQGSVFKILCAYADQFAEKGSTTYHSYDIEQLSYAKHFMDANPERKITIYDLVEMTAMSESKLRKLFRELYGLSPMDYSRNRKLLYAKQLIEDGEKISNAVIRIGFVNHSYFTRIFKKTFGVTPFEYRQSLTQNNQLPRTNE